MLQERLDVGVTSVHEVVLRLQESVTSCIIFLLCLQCLRLEVIIGVRQGRWSIMEVKLNNEKMKILFSQTSEN